MGLGQDTKDLILGNDGSDKEPDDFKTELKKAIDSGLITKADGTLLITSRTNCDKLAELIARTEEKEVTKASKEDGKEFETSEELEHYEEEKKEEKRLEKDQKESLEQQIEASKKATKARMEAEKNLGKEIETEKRK